MDELSIPRYKNMHFVNISMVSILGFYVRKHKCLHGFIQSVSVFWLFPILAAKIAIQYTTGVATGIQKSWWMAGVAYLNVLKT